MKNVLIAIRSLFKKGRHNVMKIVSLGVGLAVGLVLIAKVYFEQSYDDFYPNKDRVYQMWTRVVQNNELKDWPQTSGGTSLVMKEAIPEIEAVTRFTDMPFEKFTMTDTKSKYSASFIIADSCLFDILPRPMLIGDARDVLSRPMYVLVSSRIAKNIGGEVVGRSFTIDEAPGRTMTIGGIFEEIPENSDTRYDIVISAASHGRFLWEGSFTNLFGNDRYVSYMRLVPGADLDRVEKLIQEEVYKNFPLEAQNEAGINLTYTLHSLANLHKDNPDVKRMTWLLSLLAFALIFTAVMNYILIVVSTIVNRTREVAVHKCYGASEKNIHGMILSEAFVHIVISLLIAGLLLLAFQGVVVDLLGVSLLTLFLSKGSLVLVVVTLVVFLVSGLVPGYLYARIPVASAFRNYKDSKRMWKLALLGLQFIAAGFLLTLLVFIGRQYTYMVNDRPGYNYDNLAYCSLSGADSTLRQKVVDEVMRLPEVKAAITIYQLPFYGCSGNNVSLPGSDKELFNIADLYWVGNGYLDIMEIPVIQGRSFTENVNNSNEIMVDRRFVEKMKTVAGWTDDVVGKSITVTEHSRDNSAYTICGVYENFRLGSISDQDERPSVLFYSKRPQSKLLVKFHQLDAQGMAAVQNTVSGLFPGREMSVNAFRTEITDLYRDSRQFRDAVMIGGIITLIIALIGLIGYTNDEVNRRRKEIAVRRVNGATLYNVWKMFLIDVARIALPAVIVGGGIAYYTVQKWQEQFTEKVPLSWYIFLGCGFVVLAIIFSVVSMDTRLVANENPVNSLKSE